MKRTICAVQLALAFALIVFAPHEAAAAGIKRYALIIGANDGGADRVRLRFAESDARSVARVLSELGGVEHGDQVILMTPQKEAIEKEIHNIDKQIREEKKRRTRTEFFFYYSGHSDEEGLLPSGQKLDYRKLRKLIDSIDSDVRIVILDSCASGAMTRLKGGKRRPAFMIDESTEVKGRAFLTSSSADEAAQESDRIGASFFTHYLVSGLRGAADTTQDRRVTLNEAYVYAFNETLARTEKTKSGAQHPNYDFQLSGSGDLVMTDLRGTTAGLIIDQKVHGRLFVRDSHGQLIVELNKPAGRAVELGLEPGQYTVTLDSGGRYLGGRIRVNKLGHVVFDESRLHVIDSELTAARGDIPSDNKRVRPEDKSDEDYEYVPLNVGLFPPISINGIYDRPILNNVSLGVLAAKSARLRGAAISYGFSYQTEDVVGAQGTMAVGLIKEGFVGAQAAGLTSITRLDARGFQGSGIFSYLGGDLVGAQISGIGQYSGGDVRGFKGAGIASISAGNVRGATASGIFSYVGGDLKGAQLAGVGNYSWGGIRGAQASAIANYAPYIYGAQIGLVNITRSKVDGVQFGLVNYCEDIDGAPIGMVSVVKNGTYALDFWTSDTALTNVGFRLGSKYVHNIIAFGWQPIDGKPKGMLGWGIGVHLPYERFWFESDFMFYGVGDSDDHSEDYCEEGDENSRTAENGEDGCVDPEKNFNAFSKIRLTAGYQITDHVSVYGGGAYNIGFAGSESDLDSRRLTWMPTEKIADEDDVVVHVWPGAHLGVRYNFQ